MAKLLIIISLLVYSPQDNPTVFICDSASLEVYHLDEKCEGLQRCKHDILKISKEEAMAMYSIIHFKNEQLIVSKPLKDFMYLESKGFFRTHRSYLVNSKKVERFSSAYGNEVILENGVKVPVSRSAKEKFKVYMNA